MTNDIPEKIINTESTCFGMLIKAHGMSHVNDNIYRDPKGVRWILTKYGLESIEQYNWKLKAEQLQLAMDRLNYKNKEHVEKQAAEINTLLNKNAEYVKEIGQKQTSKSNKDKNEQIAVLKGKLKMKNIEIDELKRAVARHKESKLVKNTMSKIMISQMTRNIHAIITTSMTDCKKLEQIETLVSTHI